MFESVAALIDAGIASSLFQEVFRNFLNNFADALSVKFAALPFATAASFPPTKVDDKVRLPSSPPRPSLPLSRADADCGHLCTSN